MIRGIVFGLMYAGVGLGLVGGIYRVASRRSVNVDAVHTQVRAAIERERAGGEPARVVVRQNSFMAWCALLIAVALLISPLTDDWNNDSNPVVIALSILFALLIAALMLWYVGLGFRVAGELTTAGMSFNPKRQGPTLTWGKVNSVGYQEGKRTGRARLSWAVITFGGTGNQLRMDIRFVTPASRVFAAAQAFHANAHAVPLKAPQ